MIDRDLGFVEREGRRLIRGAILSGRCVAPPNDGALLEAGKGSPHRISGKGHTAKATPLPLNAHVKGAVDAVVEDRATGPLLVSPLGGRMTRQYAGKVIKRLGRAIEQPQLHPHALRHTFVTLSLNEGVSLRDVQDAARHADPRTTRRYDRDRHNLDRHPTHRLLGALGA
ncbi:MAG: tyrosine-type recombinase/integrase [Actinomycetota bacterium]|nr:tyrosine-type recombinase/integrase [Actinomycetota bacterium]